MTEFDAVSVTRDQVISLGPWFKIHTTVSNVEETVFPQNHMNS